MKRISAMLCKFIRVFVCVKGESKRLGRSVYYALNATSGEFAVVYEWILCWNKKIGKFFTSQEKEKIEKCKKQVGTVYFLFIYW